MYGRGSFWLTSLITPIISANLKTFEHPWWNQGSHLAPKYYLLVTAYFTPVNEKVD